MSDIHITPVGSIKVTNWLGGRTANLTLDNTNIFPYTSRDFTSMLNKKWLFGRYKAQFIASYGIPAQTLAATIFFWVIPWRLLLLLILTLIIAGLLFFLLKNKNRFTSPSIAQSQIDELEKELEALKNKYKDR